MSIGTPVAAGSANSKSDATPHIASVLVNAGEFLLVSIAFDSALNFVDGDVTWGSHTLSVIDNTGDGWFGYYKALATETLDIDAGMSDVGYQIAAATCAGLNALDKSSGASGISASPSSGNTATTTTADQLLFGSIAINGPSGDSAGSWSGSFTGLTRVGTTGGLATSNFTLEIGYRIVSATGAYAAAKTGITSRIWAAAIGTFTAAATNWNITAAAPGASAGGAPAATATPGGITVTAAAPGDATGGAPAATVDSALVVTAGVPGATVGGAPEIDATLLEMGTEANGIVDAPIGIDGATEVVQSRGVRSFGSPYFAMATGPLSPDGLDTVTGRGESLILMAAINAAPTMIASPDEVHQIASIHEIGGAEILSIGVTPSLRLCATTYRGPVLMSDAGLVPADGVARLYRLDYAVVNLGVAGTRLWLSVDDLILASRTDSSDTMNRGLASPNELSTRVMLFNGVDGATLCDCTIFAFQIETLEHNFLWPMTPLIGTGTPGYDCNDGMGEPIVLNENPAYPGVDLSLVAEYFDPRPSHPAIAGDFPVVPISTVFSRVLNTQYTKRTIVTPAYRRAGATA